MEMENQQAARCVRSVRATNYEWNQSNLVFRLFTFSCLSLGAFRTPQTKLKAEIETERSKMCVHVLGLSYEIDNELRVCLSVCWTYIIHQLVVGSIVLFFLIFDMNWQDKFWWEIFELQINQFSFLTKAPFQIKLLALYSEYKVWFCFVGNVRLRSS